MKPFFDAIKPCLWRLWRTGVLYQNSSRPNYDSAFNTNTQQSFSCSCWTILLWFPTWLVGKSSGFLQQVMNQRHIPFFRSIAHRSHLYNSIFPSGASVNWHSRNSLFRWFAISDLTTGFVSDVILLYNEGVYLRLKFFMHWIYSGITWFYSWLKSSLSEHLTSHQKLLLELNELVHPRAIVPLISMWSWLTARTLPH